MTLCESVGSPDTPLETCATDLPVPGHLGSAIGRRMTRLLMIWHGEFALGRPTSWKGHRAFEVLWKLPRLARVSRHFSTIPPCPIDGDSPFSIRTSTFRRRNTPRGSIYWWIAKYVRIRWRTRSRWWWFFWSFEGIFVTRSDFIFCSWWGEMRRCPQQPLDFHVRNLTEMQQLSLELSFCEVPRICHTPGKKILGLCTLAFLQAITMFVSLNSVQLPICSCDRAFGHRMPCWKLHKVRPCLSHSWTEKCAARDSHNVLTSVCASLLQHGFQRYCWYTMQKVSLRFECSRSGVLLCFGDIRNFGDCRRLFSLVSLVRFHTFSVCWNAHLSSCWSKQGWRMKKQCALKLVWCTECLHGRYCGQRHDVFLFNCLALPCFWFVHFSLSLWTKILLRPPRAVLLASE